MNYSVKWEKRADHNYKHTACTEYVTDGFKIWKGKRFIAFCFYTADKWHLVRTSDNECMHSARTAKECMNVLEYCIKQGKDIYKMDHSDLWEGVRFNEDFTKFF